MSFTIALSFWWLPAAVVVLGVLAAGMVGYLMAGEPNVPGAGCLPVVVLLLTAVLAIGLSLGRLLS